MTTLRTLEVLFFGGAFLSASALAVFKAAALAAVAFAAAILAAFAFSAVVFGALKATIGVRVSDEEEEEGLDKAEHGAEAYPDFN